jgi:hypothetical protein
MDLIDQMEVRRLSGGKEPGAIQLFHGDLSAIPEKYAVDVLVVSAFPDSYTPNWGTLFEGLYQRGLDMRLVARSKEADERESLGCWLSRELPAETQNRFHFKRVLCFEPKHPRFVENQSAGDSSIPQKVAFVFRCLNHFTIPDRERKFDFRISSVAMPLLATGNQGVPVAKLLPQLLEAAIFWLEQGLPIDRLNIVAFNPTNVAAARKIFRRKKLAYARGQTPAPPALASPDPAEPSPRSSSAPTNAASYDVFVSYAHKQETDVKEFVKALQEYLPAKRIFFDRTQIPPGGQWIRMLSDAVQKSRTFVAVLSPDYSASPVCWDEFQCAKLMEYNTRQAIIKTILLYKQDPVPPIMGIYSYINCVEGDLSKLRAAAAEIAPR